MISSNFSLEGGRQVKHNHILSTSAKNIKISDTQYEQKKKWVYPGEQQKNRKRIFDSMYQYSFNFSEIMPLVIEEYELILDIFLIYM